MMGSVMNCENNDPNGGPKTGSRLAESYAKNARRSAMP